MICYCWSRTEAGTDFTLGSWCALVVRCHCQYALQHCDQSAQQWSNDWYPGGVKIIFHIPSPGLQAYGRGIFRSKHSLYEMSSFALGGLFWSEIPERGFLENLNKFHAVFWGNFAKSYVGTRPGELKASLWGNPGSATGYIWFLFGY